MPIPLKNGKTMDTKVLHLSREYVDKSGKRQKRRSLFMYWFVGKDVTTASHARRIWLTSWDRIVRNVNHRWAFVIVNAEVPGSVMPGGADDDATLKKMKDFVSELEPKILKTEGDNALTVGSK